MRPLFAILGLSVLGWLASCGPAQQSTPLQTPQPAPPPVAQPVEPPPPQGPIRVGLLLPLTGNSASLGADMLDAAQLALFDVGDNQLVLLPRDTGDTPEGAVAAAWDALGNGAQLLLGPLFGPSASAVAPVAAQANVPVLSFSNDTAVAGNGVWVLGFRPEEQVARVVDFALSRGFGRVAALVPDDAYGRRALAAWQASLGRGIGADRNLYAVYPSDAADPSESIRQLTRYDERARGLDERREELGARSDAASQLALAQLEGVPTSGEPPFDALLLADGGLRLKTVLNLLSFYDVDPVTTRYLGTMRWQEDAALRDEPALQGAWIATAPPDGFNEFSRQFESVFGRRPGSLAGLAYDATALAAVLARVERRFDDAVLTAPEGFAGRLGIFRLMPNGLTEHGLAVVELGPNSTRVIDPAATTFATGVALR
ncbi:MAG TPA: penicillin-binding protein activator [Geminicoccaceae bacterium]|nr:penicillin-binding protein activator [Geminicoccaceae bacterium]